MASAARAMEQRLAGKTILITGASSGIGRACAEEFARTAPSDLKLILAARREDSIKALASEIASEVGQGVKCHVARLDVSKPAEVSAFVPSLPSEFADIDVLVNNAGLVFGVDRAPDIDPTEIDTMLATNVTGLVGMTQAVLPTFLKRPEGGAGDIINVGSIAAREGYPGGSIYCATKAAVRAFTEALRKELIATRVRVMEIDPGQVETEFSIVRYRGDKKQADAVYKGCEPLTPEDIAEIIVFMAGRRQNVVVADTLVYPSHQGAAQCAHDRIGAVLRLEEAFRELFEALSQTSLPQDCAAWTRRTLEGRGAGLLPAPSLRDGVDLLIVP